MATSLQQPSSVADDYAALQFVVQSLLAKIATMALVKVVSCTNDGGVSPYGFVNVIPLVGQLTGDQTVVPHAVLYRLPYLRIQGGVNAVILDPEPGDIGVAGFASRDISAVKKDPAAAVANADANKGTPPGSLRQFDMADGLYFGGFLNGTPEQYVRFYDGGVDVVSPTKVTIRAPDIELDGAVHATSTVHADGAVSGDSTAAFTGDVTGNGTHLHTHTHSGVTPGGGTSGPPSP